MLFGSVVLVAEPTLLVILSRRASPRDAILATLASVRRSRALRIGGATVAGLNGDSNGRHGAATMKQVIVVNGSLVLPPGKLAAQVAHAAVAGFLAAADSARRGWLEEGMPKVVLRGGDAGELARLRDAAEAVGVPAELITDAGRTVVPPGTATCLALGPAEAAAIDPLTGALPLL